METLRKIAYVVNIRWSLGEAAMCARAYGDTLVEVAAEEDGENIDMSIRSVGVNNINELVSNSAESLHGIWGVMRMQRVQGFLRNASQNS